MLCSICLLFYCVNIDNVTDILQLAALHFILETSSFVCSAFIRKKWSYIGIHVMLLRRHLHSYHNLVKIWSNNKTGSNNVLLMSYKLVPISVHQFLLFVCVHSSMMKTSYLLFLENHSIVIFQVKCYDRRCRRPFSSQGKFYMKKDPYPYLFVSN